jgi:hypothetical protein
MTKKKQQQQQPKKPTEKKGKKQDSPGATRSPKSTGTAMKKSTTPSAADDADNDDNDYGILLGYQPGAWHVVSVEHRRLALSASASRSLLFGDTPIGEAIEMFLSWFNDDQNRGEDSLTR